MLQFKKCICTNIKKCNEKSLNSYYSHHQILFINTILNINKLTNLLKSILKIKSVRVKSVKNVINIISNIVNIQKQNAAKKNIKYKKCKHLKINLLTKYLYNNDEMHTLNSVVVQKRQ